MKPFYQLLIWKDLIKGISTNILNNLYVNLIKYKRMFTILRKGGLENFNSHSLQRCHD